MVRFPPTLLLDGSLILTMDSLATHTTSTASTVLEEREVAILPVGSTEQHGPHLPLGMDYLAAEAFADAVDRDDTIVLPTIPIGVSDHHRQFSGTLWVGPDTFEWFIRETLASIASHGISKAVVINGHGGNVDAIRRAARSLRHDEVLFAAPWNWWEAVEDLTEELFETAGGHADALETSLLMHLRPELVRKQHLETARNGAPDEWGMHVHGAELGFDTVDFTPTGAVGDPTESSPDAGERVFGAATAELSSLLDWLVNREFEELLPGDHQ